MRSESVNDRIAGRRDKTLPTLRTQVQSEVFAFKRGLRDLKNQEPKLSFVPEKFVLGTDATRPVELLDTIYIKTHGSELELNDSCI